MDDSSFRAMLMLTVTDDSSLWPRLTVTDYSSF